MNPADMTTAELVAEVRANATPDVFYVASEDGRGLTQADCTLLNLAPILAARLESAESVVRAARTALKNRRIGHGFVAIGQADKDALHIALAAHGEQGEGNR